VDRLTLDTNLLQEYLRDQPKREVVRQLLDLAAAGEVDLVVTARISADMQGELATKLAALMDTEAVGLIGSVTRLNHWVLGQDMLGSDAFVAAQEAADAELRRRGRARVPDFRDWDHLHAHFLTHRDVFVTWDKRLLEAGEIVADQLGVKLATPETYLASREP
jgi:hypothetical protein